MTYIDVVSPEAPRERLSTALRARHGGYWMLVGDFHVHAVPGDGALAPWTLRTRRCARGSTSSP